MSRKLPVEAVRRFLAVIVVVTVGLRDGGHDVRAQEEPGAPRGQAALTLLQINDVYTTAPVDGAGGLPRVATIKRRLAASGHPVILALAGDFLSPSVASTVFKGEQMVAALNAAGLDFATFGSQRMAKRRRNSTFISASARAP